MCIYFTMLPLNQVLVLALFLALKQDLSFEPETETKTFRNRTQVLFGSETLVSQSQDCDAKRSHSNRQTDRQTNNTC